MEHGLNINTEIKCLLRLHKNLAKNERERENSAISFFPLNVKALCEKMAKIEIWENMIVVWCTKSAYCTYVKVVRIRHSFSTSLFGISPEPYYSRKALFYHYLYDSKRQALFMNKDLLQVCLAE